MSAQIKGYIPKFLLRTLRPAYHFSLALLGAIMYRFPSRKLIVIGVTGTKGKTSTTEILNNILEASGASTAVLGTLRFKVGERNERNLRKMTMPGRFFVQKFLRDAVDAGCSHAVIEMTSEGAAQFRQRFIDMDALIFTNLAPEHIESHGSYEAYRAAKLSIARTLRASSKKQRLMIANADDKEGSRFLEVMGVTPLPFSLKDGEPIEADETHITLTWHGERITSLLPGMFNAYNILSAATCASALGIPIKAIKKGVEQTKKIEGRMEYVDGGQSFPVIVDYAHTPDSLEAVYKVFPNHTTICVLGNTGGGRDKWKRPVMGNIADKYCSHIILTNEDPYDEDPETILNEIQEGITTHKPLVILDRREAIAHALSLASELADKSPAVLITGKGTDPFIMGPNGTKLPWDDREVAEEELAKLLSPTPQ
jgi:UDP-N-acetylmuramoyl-L-alanyl-D-glutamate--2,6-diaminopimelate ligase